MRKLKTKNKYVDCSATFINNVIIIKTEKQCVKREAIFLLSQKINVLSIDKKKKKFYQYYDNKKKKLTNKHFLIIYSIRLSK